MVNKKGLVLALMTAAFAGLCATSHALAPVVTEPGDVIIGDLESGAANNVFAFDDAFSLDGSVTDESPDATIQWSYVATDGNIRINNVVGLNLGPENPTNPPAAKNIRGNDGDLGHPGQDAQAQTVTFRNNNLSDITVGAGFGPYAEPATTGVLPLETRTLTLYASDGATTSLPVNIVVYTSNNTSDSLSGGGLENIFDFDYTNPALRTGWLSEIKGGASAATTGTGTGFCMWVPTNNVSTAAVTWFSPNNSSTPNGPGYIPLIDNMAYRLRATMYCDQTAANAIPFWTFGYNNVMYAPTLKANVFGGDHFHVDVAGGASGIGRTQGRTVYDFWFIPNAALTQAWRGTLPNNNPQNAQAMVGNPITDALNDINLSVRILDGAQGAGTIRNDIDTGTICLKSLRADRVAFDKLSTTPINAGPIDTATHAVFPDREGSAGDGTGIIDNPTDTANFNMGPNLGTNLAGGRKLFIHYNPAGTTLQLRTYAMANNWKNNELLLMKSTIRSNVNGGSGTVEGTDPLNLLFADWDTLTNEIGGFNFTQKAAGIFKWSPSPRLLATTGGVPQQYVSLFYTQNKTVTTGIANADRIRGYLDFQNNTGIGSATDGRDPFSITSFGLYKVDTSGFN